MTLNRGRLIHSVYPAGPCVCRGLGPLDVYENVAHWRCCGRDRALRPLPAPPKKPYRTKKAERRAR